VAFIAAKFFMSAIDGEIGGFIMIEQPCFPRIGIVTGFAVSTQPGLMGIIASMAMITVRPGITVDG
jgi:hypothetical protein